MKKPVAVIGGGLAGLTAARYLRQQGVPVQLYEAGKKISGLAQSFHDSDGFTYDFGAHFITNRLAAAIGVGHACRDVRYYGETVRLGGRNFSYPFGLMKVPRLTSSGIRTRAANLIKGERPESAADWFRARYGRALADEVAIPLTEAWSGASASELAPSVGDSIPGSIARTLMLKLASRVTGRAVACGYSREMPESAHVWHVYPNDGVSLLCRKLAESIEDAILLESPVEKIIVESGRAVAVRVHGQEHEVSAVVSTAPCNILAKLTSGTDALEALARFRYRPMVFVNMRFRGRGLLPDVVAWTPEKQFPFFRLTEATLSMPWLAPEGKTLITVDIGCAVGDSVWNMSDEELGELCLGHLSEIVKDARTRYMGCRVLRTPIAYPVFLKEYESDRVRFEHSTGVENLYSVGRNGEFAHIFMEDVYWRTLRKMRGLVGELGLRASSTGT
ncbi:MAG TPA: FAD-dependent oxidoreductase [Pyrinomonadaceae bacterium]|nr:FAD-dependent oxidoreductase [Pyrinomonadaceae bacterium]